MGACILARWRATLGIFTYFWLGAGAVMGVLLLALLILGREITAGPFLVILLMLAIFLIILLIGDVIGCLLSPGSPLPVPPKLPFALTNPVDCATAQQMLADARARVSQLEAELQAQVGRVAAAQQALNVARMSLAAAGTALAVTFFSPWAIPAALAAVGAATYYVWRSAQNLDNELKKLEALAARLLRAQLDLAAAESLVSQTCTTTVPPSVPAVGGIGLTAGAVHLIAFGDGRRPSVGTKQETRRSGSTAGAGDET